MHPHIKFGFPTSKNIEVMQFDADSRNLVRGQGYSYRKMERDISPFQDAFTHQISASNIKRDMPQI